jgi:hypothetical protein
MNFGEVDTKHLQRAIFVYNALLTGWSAKILPDGRYEFSKNLENEDRGNSTVMNGGEVSFHDYLYKFIRNNISLDKLKYF